MMTILKNIIDSLEVIHFIEYMKINLKLNYLVKIIKKKF